MRKELQNLLELLSTEEYHTAEELSEHLGISQKTVRTRLRELSDEGKAYGAKAFTVKEDGNIEEVENVG